MHNIFKFFGMDEGKELSMRLVNLISLYIQIVCLLGMVILYRLGVDSTLLGTVLLFMFAAGGIWIYSYYTERYTFASYAFCFLLNLAMFPLLFILGGGLYSGMPILFLGGYALTFVLLDGYALRHHVLKLDVSPLRLPRAGEERVKVE